MNKTNKDQEITALVSDFGAAKAAFFTDYKGLTVEQMTTLRKQLRPLNVKVKVVKNNLARVAVKKAELGDKPVAMLDTVVGPTLIAFAFGDPAATAKVISKFADENDVFTVKESLLGKDVVSAGQVTELAKLPSKEVLLAKLLGTLNAPVTNFVGVLAAVPRNFVQVLAAIQQKKEKQS